MIANSRTKSTVCKVLNFPLRFINLFEMGRNFNGHIAEYNEL